MTEAAIDFQAAEGEVACPNGYSQVSNEIVINYRDPACRAIGIVHTQDV